MYASAEGLKEDDVIKRIYRNIGSAVTDQAAVNGKFLRGLNCKRKEEITTMDRDENVPDIYQHVCQLHYEINISTKTDDAIYKYENNNEDIIATGKNKSQLFKSLYLISKAICTSPSDKYQLRKLWSIAKFQAPKPTLKIKIKKLKSSSSRDNLYLDNCFAVYWHFKNKTFDVLGKLADEKAGKRQIDNQSYNIIEHIKGISFCPRMLGALRAVTILFNFVIKPLRSARSGKCSMYDAVVKLRELQKYFDLWKDNATQVNTGEDVWIRDTLKSIDGGSELKTLLFENNEEQVLEHSFEALQLIFTSMANFNRFANCFACFLCV